MQYPRVVSRRRFLYSGVHAMSTLPLAYFSNSWLRIKPSREDRLSLHIFSKHLHFLDYRDMAKAAADLGFDGVELTVRKNGHVLPELVERDLPKAVEAIQNAGIQSQLMVTGITSVNATSRKVLKMAANLGIEYYRLGYYRYPEDLKMTEALEQFRDQMADLANLSARLGLKGTYQNHAGGAVGASIWEVWQLLEKSHRDVMGSQYDIRHAVVEGGASWRNGLRLISPRINTLVLKDFRWEQVNGEWKILNTPLGEGMVDFRAYFKLLKEYQINVPVSMHFEYDLDGAEHGERDLSKESRQKVYKAMLKDVEFAHRMWKEA